MKTTYIKCLVLVSILFYNKIALASNWSIKLELENTYNEDWDRKTSIEPTLGYQWGQWKTQIEYDKPVHPNSADGKIEWQLDYNQKYDKSKLTLRNEIVRDLDKKVTKAELTPSWYYKYSPSLQIGFDLEIDYYDSSADSTFDLFEVEVEPTIKWSKSITRGKLSVELEAPVVRIYSNDETEDDYKIVGVELIMKFQQQFSESTDFIYELKLPYDIVDNELQTHANLAFKYRF